MPSSPPDGLESYAAAQEEFDPTHFLYERYAEQGRQSRLLSAYYTAKPLIPRRLQLAVRRLYARRQKARTFPAWPIEPILVDHQHSQLRLQLRESESSRIPLVNFWPYARQFCVIVTHDVEGPAGITNISRVLDVERRNGFSSAWNFVAEGYEVPSGLFDEIRAAGCEIGLHGIKHDGRLFRDCLLYTSPSPRDRS